ncbi:MAG: hypothetical protein HY279_11100 [Nitrospinae bacterium]|nr:hypothetical protein [Nitrospinota bacterium]
MGSKVKGQGTRSYYRLLNIYLLLSIAFFLLPYLSHAAGLGNLKVSSSIAPSEIRIGEMIEFKVLVEHDKGIDIFYPDESVHLQHFEVLKHKVTSQKGGLTEIVYTITVFDAGEFVIPPVLITAKDRFGNERNVRTVEHKVAVKTGAIVGGEIMDIIPPMDVTEGRQYIKKVFSFLPYVITFLSAIAVIIYLLRKRSPLTVVNKDDRAKALERLKMLKVDEDNIGAVYFDIAEALRVFLYEHTKINALKMTSGEIVAGIRKDWQIDKIVHEAADLFFDLDLVKFSPFKPSRVDAVNAVSRAEQIVKEVP